MISKISFILDGKQRDIEFNKSNGISPTTTVLNYLRKFPNHKGVKEGCAEGDCGACTVVIAEVDGENKLQYKALNSCLIFLPMLHGKQLITVENLRKPNGELHPVQQSMVDEYGSQCGYCTPGIVMSMFALYKTHNTPTRYQIDDALTGNLCRCTGYRPIVDATAQACVHNCVDHFTDSELNTIELLKSIPKDSIEIKTKNQRYHRPATLKEAIVFIQKFPDAIIVNGATDIALRVTKGHELLETLLDLSEIKELKQIVETKSEIVVGSGVPLNEIKMRVQKDFPAFYEMLDVFAAHQIRNLATLGGNLGSASPIGDTIPLLMAYNAVVVLEGMEGKREIPVNNFIIGYRKTERRQDELITAIKIPKVAKDVVIKFYKISKRKDLDISTLSAGFRIELDNGNVKDVILAYGGMAERTKRATNAENFLIGKNWQRNTIEEAMKLIETDFTPISDVRGSAEFRIAAAKNLLLKFWNETEGLQDEIY